jgi:hypothetical protein
MQSLPWLAYGLMMPAVLVPMLLPLDLYNGHAMGAVRLTVIVGLAVTYTYMFVPRVRKR